MTKQEKIEYVGEYLYNEARHQRILTHEEWDKKMYEALDEQFPSEQRVGQYVADVETYAHNKYSFGFCDLCGDIIFYDDDTWYDLCMLEGDEGEWLAKTLPYYKQKALEEAQDLEVQDVCSGCFHDLCTEEGFRSIKIEDYNVVKRGGKSHTDETLGEFLDEAELKATDDLFDIDFALLSCGCAPLSNDHYPFLNDWEKLRDFIKLTKEEFLPAYSYVKESEYDMTKKLWEEV